MAIEIPNIIVAMGNVNGIAVAGPVGFTRQSGFAGFVRIGVGIYDLTTDFSLGQIVTFVLPDRFLITTGFFGTLNGPNGVGEVEVNVTGDRTIRVTAFRETGALDDAIFSIVIMAFPQQ